MAKVTPKFVQTLTDDLRRRLAVGGVNADISSEPVPGTKMYRFLVISPQFENLRASERQDLVWRVAEKVLNTDEQFKISMILTLASSEAAAA